MVKRRSFAACLVFAAVSAGISIAVADGQATARNGAEQSHLRVCGIVQKVTCDEDRSRNTTIELKPGAKNVRVTILSTDRKLFSPSPEESLPGADVCLTGTVDSSRHDRLLLVRDGSGIEVRKPAQAQLPWSLPHYRPCDDGIEMPVVAREVRPTYTREAMRALIQGTVGLDVLVAADGSVVEARVTKSLDAETGLDRQAIAAVQQWRFKPATRYGANVPIVVEIELSFRLK